MSSTTEVKKKLIIKKPNKIKVKEQDISNAKASVNEKFIKPSSSYSMANLPSTKKIRRKLTSRSKTITSIPSHKAALAAKDQCRIVSDYEPMSVGRSTSRNESYMERYERKRQSTRPQSKVIPSYERFDAESSDDESSASAIMEEALVSAIQHSNFTLTREQEMYHILKKKLNALKKMWGLKSGENDSRMLVAGNVNPFSDVTKLWSNFRINWAKPNMDELHNSYKTHLEQLKQLYLDYDTIRDSIGSYFVNDMSTLQTISHVCENAYNSALALMKVEVLQRPLGGMTFSERKFMKPFMQLDKLNDKQKLYVTLCGELAKMEFRRGGNKCFKEIVTPENHHTQAYVEVCSIQDFIKSKCSKELDFENWNTLTKTRSEANAIDLEKTFMVTDEVDFPVLKLDRHKFSFRNGIYLTKLQRTNADGYVEYYAKFYPYDSKEFLEIDKSKASSKYFDRDFIDWDCEDWYDIPTPYLQSILEYQYSDHEEYEEISRTVYALIGRMLYNRGELDNWQVMVYIQGMAGSGKSTISGTVLKEFYHSPQIAEIDNKIERQFGLGPLCDPSGPQKFITIGDELDQNCQLDLTHLLKMVSGDEIQASVKHKDPIYLRWPHHMWFSGNEIPGWKNKQGALTRRMINIVFEKKVKAKDRDPELGDNIRSEIASIIQKSVRAYLELRNRYAKRDFWSFCTKYFKDTQSQLANLTNVLREFLESEEVIRDPKWHVSEHDFYERLVAYAHNHNNHNFSLRNKRMAYSGMIQELNEERGTNLRYVKVDEVEYQQRILKNVYFFKGIKLMDGGVGDEDPDYIEPTKLPTEDEDSNEDTDDDEDDDEEDLVETFEPKTSPERRPQSSIIPPKKGISTKKKLTIKSRKVSVRPKTKLRKNESDDVNSDEDREESKPIPLQIDTTNSFKNNENPFATD